MRGVTTLRAVAPMSFAKPGAQAPHADPEWGPYLASGTPS